MKKEGSAGVPNTQQMPAEANDDPVERAARERLGEVLGGKWNLQRVLGTGAMASVYLGVHRNGSRVAIKILRPSREHPQEALQRFLREGYIANKAEHPGIVRVLDDGVAPDGAPFLVMELVDGESLSTVLAREGRFDPLRAAMLGGRILDALAAAHAKGIVHRDIKPANVLLARDGSLKVLDFGIARFYETTVARPMTVEGWVLGTPAFMPPEQALGAWAEVNPRTDIWAVGATLFALLTGQSVRDEAESANEALLSAMWKPVMPIGRRRPDLPSTLAAVIDRALSLDQADRWPTALAMKAALEAAIPLAGPPARASLPPGTLLIPFVPPSFPRPRDAAGVARHSSHVPPSRSTLGTIAAIASVVAVVALTVTLISLGRAEDARATTWTSLSASASVASDKVSQTEAPAVPPPLLPATWIPKPSPLDEPALSPSARSASSAVDAAPGHRAPLEKPNGRGALDQGRF